MRIASGIHHNALLRSVRAKASSAVSRAGSSCADVIKTSAKPVRNRV
jgi:hypothetical protein